MSISMATRAHPSVRNRWVRRVTAGELVGFVAPVAAVPAVTGSGPEAGLAGMVAAGAFEGAVLGAAQASVLVGIVPGFPRRTWVVATAAAASFAWFLGMLPATAYSLWRSWPVAVTAVVGVLLSVLLLISIGSVQALLLPVGTRLRWMLITTGAWFAGIGAFFLVTTPLWQPGQSTLTVTVVGVVGGALMALVMASLTVSALPRRTATPGQRMAGS